MAFHQDSVLPFSKIQILQTTKTEFEFIPNPSSRIDVVLDLKKKRLKYRQESEIEKKFFFHKSISIAIDSQIELIRVHRTLSINCSLVSNRI